MIHDKCVQDWVADPPDKSFDVIFNVCLHICIPHWRPCMYTDGLQWVASCPTQSIIRD